MEQILAKFPELELRDGGTKASYYVDTILAFMTVSVGRKLCRCAARLAGTKCPVD